MENRRLGAKALVWWAIGGAMLIASPWFLAFLPVPRDPVKHWSFGAVLWSNRLRFAAFLLPALAGLGVSLRARKVFRIRFLDGEYTEAELLPVRRLLDRAVWRWGGLVAVLGGLAWLVVSNRLGAGVLMYLLILPSQTAQDLARLLNPWVERRSPLLEWRQFKPLRSEHWGQHKA